MKNVLLSLTALAAMGASAVSFAQTCASPLPIRSNTTYPNATSTTGTTCGGTPGLNLGGTIYPHPSIVYSFVANNAMGNLTITGAMREIALTTSCANAPSNAAAPGVPMVIAPGSLTNGATYLLVVSTDPSEPPVPPICGTYTINTPTLPVSLQNFSVE